MKKGFKTLLIVSCILVIVGLIITIAALVFGASESLGDLSAELNKVLGFIDDDFYEPPLDFDGTIAAAPGADSFVSVDLDSDQPIEIDPVTIRAINIEWISGNIIITGGAPEFIVEENNHTSNKTVCYLKEGILYIKYKEDMRGIDFSVINEKKDIVVRLPSSVSEKLDFVNIYSASADVEIANLTAGKMDLGTASGDCSLLAVNAAEFDASTASGNISMSGNYQNAECDTASGEITADGMFREFSAETASGDVSAIGMFDNFSAETASGEVELMADSCPLDLDISTASGDVKISVPSESSFTLEFDSASGDLISDDFKGNGTHILDGGQKLAEFEIETTSGDLFFNLA